MSPGKKKPSGGNGGIGGNVYITADKSLTSMNFQTFHFNAEDGRHGGSKFFFYY
jgi:GTPase involved in cell partitioning and DNA repair